MRNAPTTSNWTPLVTLLRDEHQCAHFMFMGTATFEGAPIFLYKSRSTRRYLNIDADGKCYRYKPKPEQDGYLPLPQRAAVAHVSAD